MAASQSGRQITALVFPKPPKHFRKFSHRRAMAPLKRKHDTYFRLEIGRFLCDAETAVEFQNGAGVTALNISVGE